MHFFDKIIESRKKDIVSAYNLQALSSLKMSKRVVRGTSKHILY